jgi:hypothetical protein
MGQARPRGRRGPGAGLLIGVGVITVATAMAGAPRAARAFELPGHNIIEAAAYRRLLAMGEVPGTGVSGRTLLAALIAEGVLATPRCFDPAEPRGVCGPEARLETPLAYWPRVLSGELDILVDRQLNEEGQCQHFMAKTSDGLSPIDPRLGVPGALATTAYDRCMSILAAALGGILRDPQLASWRLVGMYAVMHALEDSFSAAHATRDPQRHIVHLLSWKLIDWPRYLLRGIHSFPPATHHAVSDPRDAEYLLPDARDPDGRRCAEIGNPYAVPESCLTDRARAAVSAVSDLLVLTYRLKAAAVARGQMPALANPEGAAAWKTFVADNLRSASQPVELRPADRVPRPRPDLLLGVAGNIRHEGGLGIGLWGGWVFVGPAVPFALSLFGAAGYSRTEGSGQLGLGVEVGLLLPLVQRFAIGIQPAALQVACDTHFGDCTASAYATLGQLIVPLGRETWLGAQGPRWSWEQRAFAGTWFGLGFGWAYERVPRGLPAAGSAAAWDPPRFDEVVAYRSAPWSELVYFAATAASTAENQLVGAGLEVRRDRDRWDQRSGLAPAFAIELGHGVVDGSRADSVAAIPTLRAYVVADRLAVALVPALLRVGALAGHATGVDVAGRIGITLDLGRVELEVDSPPLSYVARDRWHAVPFSARLGLLFD